MPPVITFIGFHNSGKTTLASRVVRHLHQRGFRIAVIKSTKETGITFDVTGTDTHTHRQAGATGVVLAAPDQLVLLSEPSSLELMELALRYFPDMDLVVGEGFKHARQVAKIEVTSNGTPPLRDAVEGVVAVVSDAAVSGSHLVFNRDDSMGIAAFIEERFLRKTGESGDKYHIRINGQAVTVPIPQQAVLIREVLERLAPLAGGETVRHLELGIEPQE